MDTRTGNIYTPDQIKELFKVLQPPEYQYFVTMEIPPTEKQMARNPPRVIYNEPCPCGSGKMFRECCFSLTKRR
jgi:uncharacterized protein YecA (UPF0149 family)